jgi:AraC-like DNA-binding protein
MRTREWTTEAVPAADRFGYWRRAVCEGVVGAETESPRPGPFHARLAASRAADFGFATFAASGHAVVRTSAMARREIAAPFLLNLQLRGESRYGDGADAVAVREGGIALVNTGRPFRVAFPGEVSRVIAILPRALLRARVSWCGDIGAIAIDGALPAAEPLRAYLGAAGRNLASLDARTAGAFLENLVNLLALALAPAPGGEGPRRARFDALRAHVRRRIADPAYAPRRAAAETGLSLRALHRLFAEAGTSFGRFLLEARLDACRAVLEDPAQAGRAISDVAFACGFNELSHFSRAFKARYGRSPRRHRAARAEGDAARETLGRP